MKSSNAQGTQVLLVDDDPVVRRTIADALGNAGYAVVSAGTATEALRAAEGAEPGAAILDLILPDRDGIDLLGELKAVWPALPAIVITAYVEPRSVVEAMRRGAIEYLAKPVDLEVLLSTLRAALARRLAPVEDAPAAAAAALPLLGASAAMARVRDAVGRVARGRATAVLITGEDGVGKTSIAYAVHAASPRAGAPCLFYGCAEPYAPTRALFGSPALPGSGLLAAAQGGTLILDDVDALAGELQAQLLEWAERAPQGPRTALIGLTTTDAPSGPLVAWLGRVRIDVPPLRERTADIAPLARHFLDRAGAARGRRFAGIAAAAEHRLLGHSWPGNVRELRQTIARIADRVAGGTIQPEHLLLTDPAAAPAWLPTGPPRPLHEIEDAYIDHVIEFSGGNKTRAAQLLGIARETLRTRLLARTAGPTALGNGA